MKKVFIIIISYALAGSTFLSACQSSQIESSVKSASMPLHVMAVESFLADITQNIAGDRIKVDTLLPFGMDPHAFEPVPKDVARISSSDLIIINGGGIESWLEKIIKNAEGKHFVVEASVGLKTRDRGENEEVESEEMKEAHQHEEGDPHFWLDPISVKSYVANIRDGLIQIDPDGKDTYTNNADAYIVKLNDLDAFIREQANTIPREKRLIVTNHESFGYFADRYGFTVIGTIVPSVSTGSAPSAQQIARLVDHIKSTGASAIFLETGTNPQLAEQLARETGVRVVTDLYTHSITQQGGAAPTYIEMMKHNINTIVANLK